METRIIIECAKDFNLSDSSIKSLKKIFKSKEEYSYHMRNLWLIRDLAANVIGDNSSHRLFPLFKTTNELIGALMSQYSYFDEQGNIQNI